ncbi:S-adenosyl-L-methionine-dependent methyltransferase [Xylariaceae sp. FL0255]|nr:S-adenosyl-L-methionine-dependent methyltransferase [Xylariaceae sp. FL0255]
MDTALEQLRVLAIQADDAGRHKVLDGIRNLQLQLETPRDTPGRFSGLYLEVTAARIGVNLGIFKILVTKDQPLELSTFSAEIGAASEVLSRILRYLTSVGMIRETAKDTFAANSITKTLSQAGYEGGIVHFFDNIGPCFQAFPDFLVETKYQDVTNSFNTAFQRAFDTSETAFKWLPKYPERFGPLQQVMTVQGAAGVPWFEVFPFEKELAGFIGSCIFVDVGGGFGHQCHILVNRFQDLKEIIVNIPSNLIGAFGPDSQILIHEMVLPDVGVSWEAATIDLSIMCSLGARERTIGQWYALLDAAGLQALRIDTYNRRRQDSVIQAVLK